MATDTTALGGHPEGLTATARTDRWWSGSLATLIGLSGFVAYLTWAAFQGAHYYHGPYLSPLYSPILFTDLTALGAAPREHAWLGTWPVWWPGFLPSSPAFLILPFPGAFRFTCYYYRKAYYRSFAGSPPGCAVVPLGKSFGEFRGEKRLLLFQNLHRFTLYFAMLFVPILYYDAALSFTHHGEFGIGVGSIVLLVNATLLAGYTFGCHSFRHLVGGRDDCMSCGKASVKFRFWKGATWLNMRHQNFAWISLFWVAFTDLYVRMASMGIIHDFNTWN